MKLAAIEIRTIIMCMWSPRHSTTGTYWACIRPRIHWQISPFDHQHPITNKISESSIPDEGADPPGHLICCACIHLVSHCAYDRCMITQKGGGYLNKIQWKSEWSGQLNWPVKSYSSIRQNLRKIDNSWENKLHGVGTGYILHAFNVTRMRCTFNSNSIAISIMGICSAPHGLIS